MNRVFQITSKNLQITFSIETIEVQLKKKKKKKKKIKKKKNKRKKKKKKKKKKKRHLKYTPFQGASSNAR